MRENTLGCMQKKEDVTSKELCCAIRLCVWKNLIIKKDIPMSRKVTVDTHHSSMLGAKKWEKDRKCPVFNVAQHHPLLMTSWQNWQSYLRLTHSNQVVRISEFPFYLNHIVSNDIYFYAKPNKEFCQCQTFKVLFLIAEFRFIIFCN